MCAHEYRLLILLLPPPPPPLPPPLLSCQLHSFGAVTDGAVGADLCLPGLCEQEAHACRILRRHLVTTRTNRPKWGYPCGCGEDDDDGSNLDADYDDSDAEYDDGDGDADGEDDDDNDGGGGGGGDDDVPGSSHRPSQSVVWCIALGTAADDLLYAYYLRYLASQTRAPEFHNRGLSGSHV
ncbi:unnamed protein product [Schistocephalus solidus]|uniref:Uncharacterized protein n=1 Tax=Schistocephalus solidus TaxID=70667 RepID=A0A183SP95_SCHSO|nr:unnamed protein product [Schistocephalus solidus]